MYSIKSEEDRDFETIETRGLKTYVRHMGILAACLHDVLWTFIRPAVRAHSMTIINAVSRSAPAILEEAVGSWQHGQASQD